MVEVIALLVFLIVFYFGFVRSGVSLAPWVPAKQEDLKRINRLARLEPGQTFVEAGTGDGRVAIYVAKHNPSAQVIGLELSPLMYVFAKLRAIMSGAKNLTITYADALKYDMHDADVVYAYGLPKTVNNKMMPKLKQELTQGARFVSYVFKIAGKSDIHVDTVDGAFPIYVYTKP